MSILPRGLSWLAKSVWSGMIVYIWISNAVLALTYEATWLNGWLRAGVIFYAIGWAIFPFPWVVDFSIARLLKLSIVQSVTVKVASETVAFALVAIGLAVKNNAGGYIAAWLLLPLVAVYGWLVRTMLRMAWQEKREPSCSER